MSNERFSIGELAGLAGISRRSVRYYVQVGLLPPPEGGGRGHYYTRAHLEILEKIRFWQEDGLSLDQIRVKLAPSRPGPAPAGVPCPAPMPVLPTGNPPELWVRLPILEGVEILVKSGLYRVTPGRLAKLVKAVQDVFLPPQFEPSTERS